MKESRKGEKQLALQELKEAGFTNYYLQMFDEEISSEKRIGLLLKLIGISRYIKGYIDLKQVIVYMLSIEENLWSLGQAYQYAAQKNEITSKLVAKHIEDLIKNVWDSIPKNLKFIIFGNVFLQTRPTNSNFIFDLANFLKVGI